MMMMMMVMKDELACVFQSYMKIYQGEELPHPKSMLQVSSYLSVVAVTS